MEQGDAACRVSQGEEPSASLATNTSRWKRTSWGRTRLRLPKRRRFLLRTSGNQHSPVCRVAGGHLRGCGLSGADGPDRVVGDYQADGFLGRDLVKGAEALTAQHIVGEAGFTIFEDFSHANDEDESGFDGGLELEVDGVIGLAEVLAAFGVPDDDVGNADCEQHGGVDFSGEGAFLFPVEILSADGDVRSFGSGDGGLK